MLLIPVIPATVVAEEGRRPVSSNGTDMRCSTYLLICGVYEYAEFTPLTI